MESREKPRADKYKAITNNDWNYDASCTLPVWDLENFNFCCTECTYKSSCLKHNSECALANPNYPTHRLCFKLDFNQIKMAYHARENDIHN
jgi:hypothetical protein